MSRRRSRRNEERRRAFFATVFKLALVGGAFGLVCWYSYEVGYRVAKGEVSSLQDQVHNLTETTKSQEEQVVGAHAALVEAQKQVQEMRALYDQVKPSDEMRDIDAEARARLAAGVDPKRLVLLIRAAQKPQACESAVTKRFFVRTPRYKGAATNAMARLSDMVTLSAEGQGANEGREQWFDPDRPLKLHISSFGKEEDVTAKLPIERVVQAKNADIHFTVMASTSRGFVDVTSERCDYR